MRGKLGFFGSPPIRGRTFSPGLAVLVAVLLYVTLPGRLTIGPPWLVPGLELALIVEPEHREAVCDQKEPPLEFGTDGHGVACHVFGPAKQN